MVGKLQRSISNVMERDPLLLSSKLTTTYSADTRTCLGIVSMINNKILNSYRSLLINNIHVKISQC